MGAGAVSRYFTRSTAIAARALGGETIIMSAKDSTLFTLNEVGSAIWNAADGRTPLEQVAERLSQEYDVDPATALRDAEEFLGQLAEHGILTVSEQPLSPQEAKTGPAGGPGLEAQ